MGKIDQLENTVYHGVAQGDQGVYATHRQTVGELLSKQFHVFDSNKCIGAGNGVDQLSGMHAHSAV